MQEWTEIIRILTNMLPGRIAIRHGCKGPNFSIASACSSGNHAIGESLKIIQSGQADVMVAGGEVFSQICIRRSCRSTKPGGSTISSFVVALVGA